MRCCHEILHVFKWQSSYPSDNWCHSSMHLAGIFDAQLTKLVLSLHAYFRGLSDELVSKSSFNAVLCMTAGIQTSSLEKYLRVPLYYSTVFSDDRKRRLLTVDILSGWLLPLAEKLDVYHKKTESWKDIDWQSEASCSDNILSYPPFYPLLRLLLLRCYFS